MGQPVDVLASITAAIPASTSYLQWFADHGPRGPCKCRGEFGPVKSFDIGRHDDPTHPGEPLWNHMVNLDLFQATASSVTYVGGKRSFMESSGLLVYVLSHLMDSTKECAPGTASLLLNALDLIDEYMGAGEARRLLAFAAALAVHSRSFPCHLGFPLLESHFSGGRWVSNLAKLPMLFSEEKPILRCADGAPKIFIYETGEQWTRPLLSCAGGLAATEVWVHQQLLRSDCRVHTPDEAELLYVPIYARCLYARKHGSFDRGYSWENPFTNATEWYNQVIRQLSHFKTRPKDHVFLFPEERWPVPEQRVHHPAGQLGRSIVVSPESRPLQCDDSTARRTGYACEHLPPRAAGVVVIPSCVETWRKAQLQRTNLPLDDRVNVACFMGLGLDKAYSLTPNFRHLLQALVGKPGFVVGSYDFDYGTIMGSSIFCLIPKGVGTWTHRLFEAMLAGCIPVILSDEVQLPFQWLNWKAFSIKWPMRRVGDEPDAQVSGMSLAKYLQSLTKHPALGSMKVNVDAHACWFDYHSEVEGCSPLHGLTRELHSRGIRSDISDQFWGLGVPDDQQGHFGQMCILGDAVGVCPV